MNFKSKFGILVLAVVLTLVCFNVIANTFSARHVIMADGSKTSIVVHVSGFKILN